MGKMRRRFTAEEKLKVIKEVQTSGASIAEVCRRHQMSTGQYYQWLSIAEQGAKEALNGERKQKASEKEGRIQRELERMKSVIAEITAENLDLKKSFGE